MIPVNEPLLNGNEKKYLNECIDTGWISSEGPFVNKFEESFSSIHNLKHGISVCNGTAALETALFALGIGYQDEVIMPSFTIISCAVACLKLGAIPVLVDIEPDTWTMDATQIEAKITSKTKAIMAVHIYGHPVNMDPIFELAENYSLKIIEDAAEVHGAEYFSIYKGHKWLKCGAMGDISATSFYANKIITTGEGGMVLTDNDRYAEISKSYRNLCFGHEERFRHNDLGYNFRMTNIQAAIGLAQTERFNEFIFIKTDRGEYYREKLQEISGIKFQPIKKYAKSVYWMYAIELDPHLQITALEMMEKLKNFKIGTRPFFRGLHAQPALEKLGLFQGEPYPNTDTAYKYGLYLPSGMTLSYEQIDEVVNTIKKILGQ
jgi:perosamine synthetase